MNSLFPPTLQTGMIHSLCEAIISTCQQHPNIGNALFKLTYNWSFRTDEDKIKAASEAMPEDYGQTRATESHWTTALVKEVADEMGAPTPGVFIQNSTTVQASSFSHNYTIQFETPILKLLDREELKAVAAHEIKHLYQNKSHHVFKSIATDIFSLGFKYIGKAFEYAPIALTSGLIARNHDDIMDGSSKDLESLYRAVSESPIVQSPPVGGIIASAIIAGSAAALGMAHYISKQYENEHNADKSSLDVTTPDKTLSAYEKINEYHTRRESKIMYKFASPHPKKAKLVETIISAKEKLGIAALSHPSHSSRTERLEKEIAERDSQKEASR